MSELEKFFEELKSCYLKEKQNFNWEFDTFSKSGEELTKEFLHYIAYNFSKNVIHGPLPSSIHSRMILENNRWSKKYVEYLESK
jgi:hypothetical protein